MRQILITWFFFMGSIGQAHSLKGVSHPHEETSEASEFSIEPGLVQEIFNSVEVDSEQKFSRTFQVGVSVNFLSPSQWKLSNEYFTIDYANNVSMLPSIEVVASFLMKRFGRFEIGYDLRAGYGYQTGIYSFESVDGGTRTDNVQIHRVPAAAEMWVDYLFEKIPLRPMLGLGAGVVWSYQAASIDGFGQGFWTPFYVVRPAVVLFPSRTTSDWFGGVRVSFSKYNSFGSSQEMSGTGYEIGLELNL